jgi:FMN phosphatase YigB (HAD superfamily)
MSIEKMTQALLNVKAIVWDYDGVYYDYATFPPLKIFDDVRTIAARKILPVLSEEEARRIGEEGYELYGDAVHNYMLWAQANGHDAEDVRAKIFKGYHRDLFNHLVQAYPQNITRDAEAVEAFRRCANEVQHGLATHSCIEFWARPYLARQDFLQFFNEKALIGLDDVGYARKTESALAIIRALEPLNVPPHKAAFAEDTLDNLKYAHANLPGLTTIFIHYGKPLKTLPPYVTMQAHDPKSVMKAIALTRGL